MTQPDIRKTLVAIAEAIPLLQTGAAELRRRAKISSRKDGYPVRASGSQAAGVTRPTRVETIDPFPMTNDGSAWGWRCSCGTESTTADPWPSSHAALVAGMLHLDESHSANVIDYSDPTGDAAAANATANNGRPDPVELRNARCEREIDRAWHAIQIALAQLHEPSDFDAGHRWCQSCSRIRHDDPKRSPHLTPPWSRHKGKVDVGGRLAEPMDLCRFCYEHVMAEGVLPPRPLLTEYLVKGRAPRKTA